MEKPERYTGEGVQSLKDYTQGRYWVFEYMQYYPNGGMGDFTHSVDDLSDVLPKILDYRDILDTETGNIIDLKTKL